MRYESNLLATRDTPQQNDLLQQWRDHLDQWGVEIEELNKLVAEINLKQPGEKLKILKLTLGDELGRAGANREFG